MLTDQWQCPCGWANSELRKRCRNCGEAILPDEVIEPLIVAMDRHCSKERKPIYTASKTHHAPRWRALRDAGWPINSTWIDEAEAGQTLCYTSLWDRCISEATSASAVLLYCEPGDVLKGAFVEAGAALAAGVPVHAVGCASYSFVNHPLVTQHDTLDAALAALVTPSHGSQP